MSRALVMSIGAALLTVMGVCLVLAVVGLAIMTWCC